MTNYNKQSVRKNTSLFSLYPQQVAGVQNLLTQFFDNVKGGFSDQAWEQANFSMKRLSGFLYQTERDILGNAWSAFYVDENVEKLKAAVDIVRSRI